MNPDFSGNLQPVELNDGVNDIKHDNNIYSIEVNNGYPEIKSVHAMDGNSEMRLTFSPPFPDVKSLKDNTEINGRFIIEVDDVKGIIGGLYYISKKNDSFTVQMKPQEGWQPMPGKLWMKTYLWNCDIKLSDEQLRIDSKWKRIK